MDNKKPIELILRTKDKQSIRVECELLKKYSNLIGNMLETTNLEDEYQNKQSDKQEVILPFYNISSQTMAIIIMFLQSFKPEATLCLPVTATNMQHK